MNISSGAFDQQIQFFNHNAFKDVGLPRVRGHAFSQHLYPMKLFAFLHKISWIRDYFSVTALRKAAPVGAVRGTATIDNFLSMLFQ